VTRQLADEGVDKFDKPVAKMPETLAHRSAPAAASTNSGPELGLEKETETELVLRVREHGDSKARNRLLESHLGLVKRMAAAFARRGANFEDLELEGRLALMRAVETFEPDRNVRFATYAAYWIRAHMQRYLASLRSHQDAAPASVGAKSRNNAGRGQRLRTCLKEK
jgi:DNA-directed RNA polymerase sigma subunit (sigma70/sigma32)